jgi:hypothetical protein
LVCALLLPNLGYSPSVCQESLPRVDFVKRLAELEYRLTRLELRLEVYELRIQASEEEALIDYCTRLIKKQPMATERFFDQVRQDRNQSQIRLEKLNDLIKKRTDIIWDQNNHPEK